MLINKLDTIETANLDDQSGLTTLCAQRSSVTLPPCGAKYIQFIEGIGAQDRIQYDTKHYTVITTFHEIARKMKQCIP